MEDQQYARTGTGQASDGWRKASWQVATGLYSYVAAVPGWCWVAIGALTCGTVIYFVYWRPGTCRWLKRNLARWSIIPITIALCTCGAVVPIRGWVRLTCDTLWLCYVLWCFRDPLTNILREYVLQPLGVLPITFEEKDLMAIPCPEENIRRTFVGVLSSETANKLKAMFRNNFCPEIVPFIRGNKLTPECRLVICCLPKNTRQLYLDNDTSFAELIKDAGSLKAMVLIIIFGEKKTPKETLHLESIYGKVLRQGRELYMKGRGQASLLREQTRSGVSERVALVTVDNCPSKHQLAFMKKFVETAFTAKE